MSMIRGKRSEQLKEKCHSNSPTSFNLCCHSRGWAMCLSVKLQGLNWRPSLRWCIRTAAKAYPVAVIGSELHIHDFYRTMLTNWFKLNWNACSVKVLCHCKSEFKFLGDSLQVQESLLAWYEVLMCRKVIIFFSSLSSFHLLLLQQLNRLSWLLNCYTLYSTILMWN